MMKWSLWMGCHDSSGVERASDSKFLVAFAVDVVVLCDVDSATVLEKEHCEENVWTGC